MGWGKVDRDANPRWDLQEQIKMATTDTAPKTMKPEMLETLAEEMLRAFRSCDSLGASTRDDDRMQAAARVLLERMREETDTLAKTAFALKFASNAGVWAKYQVLIDAFAREHGLSAPEDERE